MHTIYLSEFRQSTLSYTLLFAAAWAVWWLWMDVDIRSGISRLDTHSSRQDTAGMQKQTMTQALQLVTEPLTAAPKIHPQRNYLNTTRAIGRYDHNSCISWLFDVNPRTGKYRPQDLHQQTIFSPPTGSLAAGFHGKPPWLYRCQLQGRQAVAMVLLGAQKAWFANSSGSKLAPTITWKRTRALKAAGICKSWPEPPMEIALECDVEQGTNKFGTFNLPLTGLGVSHVPLSNTRRYKDL